jgi:hypothetical protein
MMASIRAPLVYWNRRGLLRAGGTKIFFTIMKGVFRIGANIKSVTERYKGNMAIKMLWTWAIFLLLIPPGECQTSQNRLKSPAGKLVVVGRVIGVEEPESVWPMEFESLKIFYFRIITVVQGEEQDKYLRIAYAYNPSSDPESKLPESLFNGKSVWKLQLTRRDIFDSTVEVSRKPRDWLDYAHADRTREPFEVPVRQKCVATEGNKDEALALEQLGKLKGYRLNPNQYKMIKQE